MKTLAVIAALAAAGIGAIQTAGPESLGLPPLAANWLGVLAVLLSAAQAFLPDVTPRKAEPKKISVKATGGPGVKTRI
ncbi:MAG TPA: hypothetical protein VD948_08750 [Rhodothermales bacterium]|nr:hypothetical protein [Rhodothermales bacterium]